MVRIMEKPDMVLMIGVNEINVGYDRSGGISNNKKTMYKMVL